MMTDRRNTRAAVLVLTLVFALAACAGPRTPNVSAPPAANPNERLLYANLFVQTAAEYEAICLQTYAWAAERLKAKLAALPKDGLPPAVVMDLDETVIDNGGFFTFIDREGMANSDAAWDRWEKEFPQDVLLVPGAKAFIEEAEGRGVAIVYISNRKPQGRNYAIATLKKFGLPLEAIDRRLMLRDETADKTGRRARAESMYRVVMWVGDNLRDFSDEFAGPREIATDAERLQAIAERKEKVRRSGSRWGDDWIVLPNPVYGEWPKLLGPNPRKFLRTTERNK
jgi:5'-nucleotidase (lipoprotein e(P4) family)